MRRRLMVSPRHRSQGASSTEVGGDDLRDLDGAQGYGCVSRCTVSAKRGTGSIQGYHEMTYFVHPIQPAGHALPSLDTRSTVIW